MTDGRRRKEERGRRGRKNENILVGFAAADCRLAAARVSHRWRVVSSLWACLECHYSGLLGDNERHSAVDRNNNNNHGPGNNNAVARLTIVTAGNNDGDDGEEGRDR